jgi:hypothetical protein
MALVDQNYDKICGLLNTFTTKCSESIVKENIRNNIKIKPAIVVGIKTSTNEVVVNFVGDLSNNRYTYPNRTGQLFNVGEPTKIEYTSNPAHPTGWITKINKDSNLIMSDVIKECEDVFKEPTFPYPYVPTQAEFDGIPYYTYWNRHDPNTDVFFKGNHPVVDRFYKVPHFEHWDATTANDFLYEIIDNTHVHIIRYLSARTKPRPRLPATIENLPIRGVYATTFNYDSITAVNFADAQIEFID